MQGPRFHPITPDQRQLDAAELRRLAEHVERLDQFSVGGPGSYIDTGAGRVLIPAPGGEGGEVVDLVSLDADGYYSGFLLEDFDPATKRFRKSTAIKIVNLADTSR